MLKVISVKYFLDGDPNGFPTRIQFLRKFHGNRCGYWSTIDAEVVPTWASAELATTGFTTWLSKWIGVDNVEWGPSNTKINRRELLNDAIERGLVIASTNRQQIYTPNC